MNVIDNHVDKLDDENRDKAWIKMAAVDGEKHLRLGIHGDTTVTSVIPGITAVTFQRMVDDLFSAGGDENRVSQALDELLQEWSGKEWELLLTRSNSHTSEDGEPVSTFTFTRTETSENDTVMGPLVVLLDLLIDNPDLVSDLRNTVVPS